MKNRLYTHGTALTLLTLAASLLFSSCAGTAKAAPETTALPPDASGDPAPVEVIEETPFKDMTIAQKLTSLDDIFDRYYDPVFTFIDVEHSQGTFVEENKKNITAEYYSDIYDPLSQKYLSWDHLWSTVDFLKLTRDDVITYNNAISDEYKMTDAQIDVLMLADSREAKLMQCTPYTLCIGERVYRIKEIEEMTAEQFRSHGFPQADITRLIAALREYPNTLDPAFFDDRDTLDYETRREWEHKRDLAREYTDAAIRMIREKNYDPDYYFHDIAFSLICDPIFDYYVDPKFASVSIVRHSGAFNESRIYDIYACLNDYSIEKTPKYLMQHQNILWYVVRDLGITRDELVKYNETPREELKLTTADINALIVKDENDARRLMRTPYTLYSNGVIYRIADIFDLDWQTFHRLDFPQRDIDALIAALNAYPDTLSPDDYVNIDAARDAARRMVEEILHKIEFLTTEEPPGMGGPDESPTDFNIFYEMKYDSVYLGAGGYSNEAQKRIDNAFDKFDEKKFSFERAKKGSLAWYTVHFAGITREEFEYNNSLLPDDQKLTKEEIDTIFIANKNEAMKAQCATFALYSDGAIYRLYEIEKMTWDEFASHHFDRTDIEHLLTALESHPERHPDDINDPINLKIAMLKDRARIK